MKGQQIRPLSLRAPNSIVQGLTTSTLTELNRLTAFEMVTLLGLLTLVCPKRPHKEVRTRLSKILQIIEVSRNVAHTVEPEWENTAGEKRRKRYRCRRYSPKTMRQVREALLVLHRQSVVIQRRDNKNNIPLEDRIVHILDSFGYYYQTEGQMLDLDDLPPSVEKVNIGSAERPVWRLRHSDSGGEYYTRPAGILFRLNTELARELRGEKGTIEFTLVTHKVFGLFRRYMKRPAALRLILLVLRQTERDFTRQLERAIDDLGFDGSHPSRAVEQLSQVLAELKDVGLVHEFRVDLDTDRLHVQANRDWYKHAA